MRIYFILSLLIMSSLTFGQQDSVVTEAHRIVSSFDRNVNKMELKENGLIISGIHDNYDSINDKDASVIRLSEPFRQTSDSITSIIETDSTLSVEFVVYESSYPITIVRDKFRPLISFEVT